jgi:hypothetical protein
MANLKVYNTGTSQWEYVVVGKQGPTGVQGPTGPAGPGVEGVTASAAELNILDGAILTTTELNYVDGVTSGIQGQLNGKANLSGATFSGPITATSLSSTGGITFTPIDIPGGADLNTYRTTGFYDQDNNGNAASGTNYPVAYAGLLEVFTNATAAMTYQRYTVYEDHMTAWYRTYYNGQWSSWYTLGTGLWNTGTAAITVGFGQWGKTYRLTGTTGRTFTLASGMPAGTRTDFVQDGTGQITFAAGSGVTLKSKDGKLKTAGQYSAVTVLAYSTTEYYLIGDLAA